MYTTKRMSLRHLFDQSLSEEPDVLILHQFEPIASPHIQDVITDRLNYCSCEHIKLITCVTEDLETLSPYVNEIELHIDTEEELQHFISFHVRTSNKLLAAHTLHLYMNETMTLDDVPLTVLPFNWQVHDETY